jgi:hypothetical protein
MRIMSAQIELTNVQATGEQSLDRRLEAIGWALLLMFTGGIWLAPDGLVPSGSWLVGVGLILLGLDLVRYMNGLRTKGFGGMLGILALLSGLGMIFGLHVPFWPILLILVGAFIIVQSLLARP